MKSVASSKSELFWCWMPNTILSHGDHDIGSLYLFEASVELKNGRQFYMSAMTRLLNYWSKYTKPPTAVNKPAKLFEEHVEVQHTLDSNVITILASTVESILCELPNSIFVEVTLSMKLANVLLSIVSRQWSHTKRGS